MPDISMCANNDCPVRRSCYRFMATPSMRQSWAGFEPDRETGRCEAFIPIGKKTSSIGNETKAKGKIDG